MPDSNPKPMPMIRRRNLGDDVYQILWARIVSRDLHPGEKLSDLRLSSELGVSRTPVREALHRLLQDGVIRAEPNRGFFVTSFSGSDIDEIFEIRAALEALALRAYLAHNPDDDFASELHELDAVEREIAEAQTDEQIRAANERFLAADQRFHRSIAEQAGNERLLAMLNGIWAQIAVFQKAGTHVPGYVEVAVRQHREIISLLHDRKHDEAIEALVGHIRDMKTRIIVDLAENDGDRDA